MNVMTTREKSQERLFEKNLCVFGQKVEDDLIINGNSVGVMAEMGKNFLKSRNEVIL